MATEDTKENLKALLEGATAKLIPSYEVRSRSGVLIGVFRATSTWNGMTELRANDTAKMIVHGLAPDPGFSAVFDRLFGADESTRNISIVTASPSIVGQFMRAYEDSLADTAPDGGANG